MAQVPSTNDIVKLAAEGLTAAQIATRLNGEGYVTTTKKKWYNTSVVAWFCKTYPDASLIKWPKVVDGVLKMGPMGRRSSMRAYLDAEGGASSAAVAEVEKSKTVIDIICMAAEGHAPDTIASMLKAEGQTQPNGKDWNRRAVIAELERLARNAKKAKAPPPPPATPEAPATPEVPATILGERWAVIVVQADRHALMSLHSSFVTAYDFTLGIDPENEVRVLRLADAGAVLSKMSIASITRVKA